MGGSPKRVRKTKAVIDLYFRLADDKQQIERLNDQEEQVILFVAISYFLGLLSTFKDELVRFRRHIDALDFIVNPYRHQPDGELRARGCDAVVSSVTGQRSGSLPKWTGRPT